jgi:hypothetical protein
MLRLSVHGKWRAKHALNLRKPIAAAPRNIDRRQELTTPGILLVRLAGFELKADGKYQYGLFFRKPTNAA